MNIDTHNELAKKTYEATLYLNEMRQIIIKHGTKGSVLKIRLNILKKKFPDKYIWLKKVFHTEKEINLILRS